MVLESAKLVCFGDEPAVRAYIIFSDKSKSVIFEALEDGLYIVEEALRCGSLEKVEADLLRDKIVESKLPSAALSTVVNAVFAALYDPRIMDHISAPASSPTEQLEPGDLALDRVLH